MKEIWAISDIHGYYDAFTDLLIKIGFLDDTGRIFEEGIPTDKFLVLCGDYIDRGDGNLEVLELIASLLAHYPSQVTALMGNHDSWLYRKAKGNDVKMTEERTATWENIKASPLYNEYTKDFIIDLYEDMPYFVDIDGYKFVHAFYAANAANGPKKKQSLMLYGPVLNSGIDEKGFPYRDDWYNRYTGKHGKVIFGHYSLKGEISEFPNAVSVDCGVFKTGTLGAYEVISGRKEYVHGYSITRD
jgi:hypothetical protein